MVCALNEEEFLEDFFEKTLPLVDKLIVCEGGVVGHPFTDKNGHSLDLTNQIIKIYKDNYPDKITWLTSKDDKWTDKQMQQNAMLNHVNVGDWCWVFGVDEFYEQDTRKKLDDLIEKYPYISEFVFSIKHLWNETKLLTKSGDYRNMRRHQRFFKYAEEMFYHNHPTVNDSENLDTFFNERYMQKKLYLDMPNGKADLDDSFEFGILNAKESKKIAIYHYGFCRDKAHQIKKHIYYIMRERDQTFKQVVDGIRMSAGNELTSLYNHIHNPDKFEMMEFDGVHPLTHRKLGDKDVNLDDIETAIGEFLEIAKK